MARILDNGHSWDDLVNVYRAHIQGNKAASVLWQLEDESTRRVIEKLAQPAAVTKCASPRPSGPAKPPKYSRKDYQRDLALLGRRL
jgi:hypothetical protein